MTCVDDQDEVTTFQHDLQAADTADRRIRKTQWRMNAAGAAAGQKHEDSGSYDQGYLEGMAAVSIDKNGRARAVTITEPRNAFVYDTGGNAYCRCATRPRTPERSTAIRPGSRAPEPARSPASASAGRNAEHERGAGIAR